MERKNPFSDPRYAEWIDRIREIPMEDVADAYGIERNGESILCPEHNDTHTGNCHIYHNRYHCFACHAKGDVIKLVQKSQHISYTAASQDLARQFDIPIYKAFSKNPSTVDTDYMPITKTQLMALGLIPNTQRVFVPESYQNWRSNYTEDVYVADPGDDNTGYMVGSTIPMSISRLYKEDKEGFFALIAGKFKEASSIYVSLYMKEIWTTDLFKEIRFDIQNILESLLITLNDLAVSLTEKQLVDLSYFKLPPFKSKKTRYTLEF